MKKSIVIIVAAAIIAVIFYGVRYVSSPVDTMVAEAKTKESVISSEGIIVYNESVYKAGNTGTFYSYTGEGERVGKDRCVATVYNGVVDNEILQSLNNIDKKIADVEEDNKRNGAYVTNSSSEQATIENVKAEIIDAVIEDDVSKMSEYKNKLKQASGTEGESDEKQTLTQLKNEKKNIESQITQKNKDIYSTISGIYTTELDGLEEVITPQELSNFTVSDYRSLKESEEGMMGNRTVEEGTPVCKVVDNHEWYVVCVISKADRERIKEGDSVKVRVSELPGENVDAKIDYISEEEEGAEEYVAVVKCERYLEGVFNIRKSGVEIILASYYGFEVPIYAIHVQDGKNGVMVQRGNSQIFKECTILNRDDENATVIVEAAGGSSQLTVGDKIILGEK